MGSRVWPLSVAVALVAVSIAGCARSDKAEIRAGDALSLSGSEGIIVGVMTVAETPGSRVGVGPRSDDLYLGFGHSGLHELSLTLGAQTPERIEQGVRVNLRPFAYRLPAGEGAFTSLKVRRVEEKTTSEFKYVYSIASQRSEWREVSNTQYIDRSVHEQLPPAQFTVAPGRVTYIGRIGVLFHVTSYGMQASERDKACAPRWRSGGLLGAHCIVRELYLDSVPDIDLPLIRKAFGNLPAQAIDVRPLTAMPGSWLTLPEALRRVTSR